MLSTYQKQTFTWNVVIMRSRKELSFFSLNMFFQSYVRFVWIYGFRMISDSEYSRSPPLDTSIKLLKLISRCCSQLTTHTGLIVEVNDKSQVNRTRIFIWLCTDITESTGHRPPHSLTRESQWLSLTKI